jgi:hypothetical protein
MITPRQKVAAYFLLPAVLIFTYRMIEARA